VSCPFNLQFLPWQFSQFVIGQFDESIHFGHIDIHGEFGGINDGYRGIPWTAQSHTLSSDGS